MKLVDHYDHKYAGKQALPKRVPIIEHPSNRFEMLVKVAAQSRGRYLEIGAGNGATLLSLEPHFEELVATELSPARTKDLEATFDGYAKIKILRHDLEAEELGWPDGYFDVVAMSAVIEHLIDPIAAVQKLHRVLRPGGKLLLDTPNIAKWTRRLKLAAGYFPSTASLQEGLLGYDRKTPTELHDEGHFHYFTFRSLGRICVERCGFSHVQSLGYGRTALSRSWPTLFSDVFLVATK